MTEQQIKDNAPDGATHIFKYDESNLFDFICFDGMRISVYQDGGWIKLSRVYDKLPKRFKPLW